MGTKVYGLRLVIVCGMSLPYDNSDEERANLLGRLFLDSHL